MSQLVVPAPQSRYGVLGFDGERVQCHICLRWFRQLGTHIGQAHGTTAVEYREEFGLARSNPLMAPDVSAKLRIAAQKAMDQRTGAAWLATTGVWDRRNLEENRHFGIEYAKKPRSEVSRRRRDRGWLDADALADLITSLLPSYPDSVGADVVRAMDDAGYALRVRALVK